MGDSDHDGQTPFRAVINRARRTDRNPRQARTGSLSIQTVDHSATLTLTGLYVVCFKTTWAGLLGCPPSWHRLGPRDMSFEAQRFSHVAEAIPGFAIAGIV